MKSGVAVSVLAPGTPDRDVEDKRATVVTYVACAVAAWVAVVVTCLAEYGGGMPAVAEAARSVRIPQAATTQLATLVAFAVVIWTDTVSMAACRDAHKRVLFGLMIMINGLPFVTYSLIVTGLAPSYLDWFGHTVRSRAPLFGSAAGLLQGSALCAVTSLTLTRALLPLQSGTGVPAAVRAVVLHYAGADPSCIAAGP